jgi:hypothetical protein
MRFQIDVRVGFHENHLKVGRVPTPAQHGHQIGVVDSMEHIHLLAEFNVQVLVSSTQYPE